ncbi:MAG: glycosyl hydrolase 108 family protein [Actinomycetota bacterium]
MGRIQDLADDEPSSSNFPLSLSLGLLALGLGASITPPAQVAMQAIANGQNPLAALTGNTYFDKALSFSLKWEGGYSNVVGDAGGRTFRGVTEAVARRHGYSDPRQLSDEKIKQIYLSDYWKPAQCDRFRTFPAALTCLDTAINYGTAFQSLNYFASCPDSDDKQWASCIVRQRKQQRYRQAARPLQAQFLNGWLNRDADLERIIGVFTNLKSN